MFRIHTQQEIVVGFRKPSGQLTTVQSFQTIQIPRMVRGKPDMWDPSVCLKWGEQFIRFLKDTISGSSPNAHDEADTDSIPKSTAPFDVWRVKFAPGAGVSVVRLDKAGVEEVEAGEERVGFLPKWYLKEMGYMSDEHTESRPTGAPQGKEDEGRSLSPPRSPTAAFESKPEPLPPPTPAGWNI